MNSNLNTEELSSLLERQLEILSALLMLAQQQVDYLGADNVELLLSMLARKQPLINELLELQANLQPFREQDPEQREWVSEHKRAHCQQLVAQCTQMHQELLRLEAMMLSELELHRNAVAAQLQDGRDATLAHTAYSAEALLDESTFDLTSS
jgi:hypothetical protein